MIAIEVKCPKGPALLAKAGVTLADAQWLYRQQLAGSVSQDRARFDAIRRKVGSFLATGSAPARGRFALA